MKYFHRTHLSPDAAIARASEFFGARLGVAAARLSRARPAAQGGSMRMLA